MYHQAPWYSTAQFEAYWSLSWSLVVKRLLLWDVRESPAQKGNSPAGTQCREVLGGTPDQVRAAAMSGRACCALHSSKGGHPQDPGKHPSADAVALVPPHRVCPRPPTGTPSLRGEPLVAPKLFGSFRESSSHERMHVEPSGKCAQESPVPIFHQLYHCWPHSVPCHIFLVAALRCVHSVVLPCA